MWIRWIVPAMPMIDPLRRNGLSAEAARETAARHYHGIAGVTMIECVGTVPVRRKRDRSG